jgi:hypothetical protein
MNASIARRLAALEAARPVAAEYDPAPEILARLALIRERLDEAVARGTYVRRPGPPSGSRLSEIIAKARAAKAAAEGGVGCA